MFLEAIDAWLDRKLVKSLTSSPYFSVLADECADISRTERLSICKWKTRGVLHYNSSLACLGCCCSGSSVNNGCVRTSAAGSPSPLPL